MRAEPDARGVRQQGQGGREEADQGRARRQPREVLISINYAKNKLIISSCLFEINLVALNRSI